MDWATGWLPDDLASGLIDAIYGDLSNTPPGQSFAL